MKRFTYLALALTIVIEFAGCQSVSWPRLFASGSTEQQQAMAEEYDPYPSTTAGPAIVGGRPIDYDAPKSEVRQVQPRASWTSSQWLFWNWF